MSYSREMNGRGRFICSNDQWRVRRRSVTFFEIIYLVRFYPFKRRVKSNLPFSGIITSSPYSPH